MASRDVEAIKNDESLDPHYREMLKASSHVLLTHQLYLPTLYSILMRPIAGTFFVSECLFDGPGDHIQDRFNAPLVGR